MYLCELKMIHQGTLLMLLKSVDTSLKDMITKKGNKPELLT